MQKGCRQLRRLCLEPNAVQRSDHETSIHPRGADLVCHRVRRYDRRPSRALGRARCAHRPRAHRDRRKRVARDWVPAASRMCLSRTWVTWDTRSRQLLRAVLSRSVDEAARWRPRGKVSPRSCNSAVARSWPVCSSQGTRRSRNAPCYLCLGGPPGEGFPRAMTHSRCAPSNFPRSRSKVPRGR